MAAEDYGAATVGDGDGGGGVQGGEAVVAQAPDR